MPSPWGALGCLPHSALLAALCGGRRRVRLDGAVHVLCPDLVHLTRAHVHTAVKYGNQMKEACFSLI